MNHRGEICEQSGLAVNYESTQVTEYFRNCDVTRVRQLRPRELKQWGIKE